MSTVSVAHSTVTSICSTSIVLIISCCLVINICGMAGIGKTHLVKHLGARLVHDGYDSLINVNAGYVFCVN